MIDVTYEQYVSALRKLDLFNKSLEDDSLTKERTKPSNPLHAKDRSFRVCAKEHNNSGIDL